MFARIENGVVTATDDKEPILLPGALAQDWRPLVLEYPEYDKRTHQIGDPTDVIDSDRVVRTWTVRPRALGKDGLVAYAAERRWRKEVGGITVNGITIPTDDRAKLLLLGAAQSMEDDSIAPLIVDGTNYGLFNKAQFQGINSALIAHVQNTFVVLAEILEDINSELITDIDQIDQMFD